MAQRKFASIQTPQERMIADRVKRATAVKSPVDRTDKFHEALCDLARAYGLEPADVVDEWGERAAVREYLGGYERDEAERLAFQDVSERLAR